MFFFVAECFYLLFSSGRGAARFELFHVNNPLRPVHSGVSSAYGFLVSFKSCGYIVRVPSVVAPIITKKYVYIVRLLLPPRFLVLC